MLCWSDLEGLHLDREILVRGVDTRRLRAIKVLRQSILLLQPIVHLGAGLRGLITLVEHNVAQKLRVVLQSVLCELIQLSLSLSTREVHCR